MVIQTSLITTFLAAHQKFEQEEKEANKTLLKLQLKISANRDIMANTSKQMEELKCIMKELIAEEKKDLETEIALVQKKNDLSRGQKRLRNDLPMECKLLIDIGRKLGPEEVLNKKQRIQSSE